MKKFTGTHLLCFILSLVTHINLCAQEFYFGHIGPQKGLTASSVQCILQDYQGFMWFGTTDGLFRYDGYGMTVYRHNSRDSTSIGSNYILTLFEDTDSTMWVGTSSGGLNRFDREKEQFIRYIHLPDDPNSLSSIFVSALTQARNGDFWAGTWKGLNKIELKEGTITRFVHDEQDPNSAPSKWIHAICEDSSGAIWLGTEGGLSHLDMQSGKFTHFVANPNIANSLSSNSVNAVIADRDGILWVGSSSGLDRFDREKQRFMHFNTDGGVLSLFQESSGALWVGTGNGLLHFDTKTYQSTKYIHNPQVSWSLNSNIVQSIYEDRTGVLWFGTRKGINRLDKQQRRFKHLGHNPDDATSLSNNGISAVHAGVSGTIWVSNWGDNGLQINKIDSKTKRIIRSLPGLQSNDLQRGGGNYRLFEDHSGLLWIATDYGLGCYDPEQKKFTRFVHNESDPHSLITNDIECVHADRNRMLWVGIYNYGPTGVSTFDFENKSFTHIEFDSKIQSRFAPKNGVASISEGRSGRLWFATKGDGIFLLNLGSDAFIQLTHDPKNPNSLSHNWVKIVHEDREGTLWAAPWSSGLNKYVPETGEFSFYSEADGLPGSDITSMIEDDDGNLWLTTQYALSRFNPSTETFKNFDRDDGLLNDGFKGWFKSTKCQTGELFFGDTNGLDYVHPDSIRDNPHVPPVVFTKFLRYNSDEASGKAFAEKGISVKRRYDLSHKDHILTFEFAALNYRTPHKNQYAYKLEGFNENWIQLGNKPEITLTNLDPGDYILHVKGSNNDGIWNEQGTSLAINISPPWWQTSRAYAIYIILAGMLLYGLRKVELRRAELNNALERKNFEAQKLKEVDEMKSRFFADISHEFRTPLTLILGPFEKVLAGIKDKDERNDLHVMRRNALRLQRLVEQLLDLSRIEAHRMPLHAQFVDIVTHIKEWTAAFVSLAESQDIRFDLKLPKEDLPVYVDVEKIEKVVFNLLSNAFKFTPESGEISVTVCKKSWDVNPDRVLNPVRIVASDCLSITVSDSGIGIPPDQLSHIFDRFYRASDALAGEQRGTGIGLALVKELVELHHGEIRVESEPGKGSSFTMLLPLGRDHLTNDEIIDPAGADTKQEFRANVPKSTTDSLSQKEISSPTKPTSTLTPSTSGGRILVVEDNEDMRRYLRNALKQNFVISEAGNGEKGFQAALKKNPDLIISDVMMPVMGGFALCEKLKTDARTSHIPVILLTARAGQGDKLEGLEIGADDYLTKPFDTLELHIRVKNLIAQRRRLRELFTRNILIQPSQITATSIDEEFLQRAMDIVEKYIADSTFQIEQFCREISMSQSTLNRKLHALTGSSANGFIRSMRLKRASQLLQQKSATIVEIAYQVGFNNPSYFAQCFREQFGVAPSDYSASPENSKI